MNVYQRKPNGPYYARFWANGKPWLRCTNTLDKREAERICRQLAKEAKAGRFKALDQTKAVQDRVSSVGELFASYQKHAAGDLKPKSLSHAISSTRTVIRLGLGRRDASNEEIDRLSLDVFNASLASQFKTAKIAEAGNENGLELRSKQISANTCRLLAHSVFKDDLRPLYKADGIVLPKSLEEFLKVKAFKVQKVTFRYPSDFVPRLREAAKRLKVDDPNCYRAYLLALGSGLRAGEIAAARWDWIEKDEAGNYGIRVQPTADYAGPKGKRERVVPVEACVVQELEELRSTVPFPGNQVSAHILEGNRSERLYRTFNRFGVWLKGLGWSERKKLHALRKIYGSLVAQQFGLYAAKECLGHADIQTTASFYVGQVDRPQVKIFS